MAPDWHPGPIVSAQCRPTSLEVFALAELRSACPPHPVQEARTAWIWPRAGLPASCCSSRQLAGPVIRGRGRGGCAQLILFGYHGKLIKLAAVSSTPTTILADGRERNPSPACALEGVSGDSPGPSSQWAPPRWRQPSLDLHCSTQLAAKRLEQRLATRIEPSAAGHLARYGIRHACRRRCCSIQTRQAARLRL